ncbi:acyl-CoA thioesterase [Pleionea sediminis]|uniref:acyl-CoA thioesterase n=1 Tax=Pleionea sediminis TaxID=2569479 RepID=UPI0011858294|nr:thioesterase family protein [Pleionea sediminis]
MIKTLEELEKNYPVIIDINIHWGDMDAFQHVNNVIYFRYFESARIAYFRQTHIMDEMETKKIGPILASTECRYRRPVTFPDVLKVGCRVSEIRDNDFDQEYAIFSTAQNALVTTGEARIVMVDYHSHQKTEISDSIKQHILDRQPELSN